MPHTPHKFYSGNPVASAEQPQGGGGGGTLILSHIRRPGLFFGVQILNFNIFGGFQKNEYFLGV